MVTVKRLIIVTVIGFSEIRAKACALGVETSHFAAAS
jgi:hypothetical protein